MRAFMTPGQLLFLGSAWIITALLIYVDFGTAGLAGHLLEASPVLLTAAYAVLLSHITIVAMSLSFHRQYTHGGVRLNRAVDRAMQAWLWMFTGMVKRDWVSVHLYHHAHSDTPEDPHSPVQKGFWKIFLFGVLDYSNAKNWPEVVRIAKRIPQDRFETFLATNIYLGPILLSFFNLLVFGPLWGTLMMVLNFATAPLFAVGGVNALAHFAGYRNYATRDGSRNIGFLFPLNWVICGELDHNNHHAMPKSASFRHRWYELDIGYVYLRLLSAVGLAEIREEFLPRVGAVELPEATASEAS
jgi:stearoyl-CoA desaturase (Delta-9 desaturase)